ncbi:MAG: type II toxin-antitoxin system VapC family toxin [Deltaproteobacteria bacterium]|nr:MAG: type II toxin-antitoxin system VapC family toxin [Deltaproteobacteria bacterium]
MEGPKWKDRRCSHAKEVSQVQKHHQNRCWKYRRRYQISKETASTEIPVKRQTIIIDTNTLISFVTDRNKDQQDKIAELFEDAARLRKSILCPQNVLTEFVYVLEKVYDISKSAIKGIITDFVSMPGIEIVHEVNLRILFSYWPDKIPDYGDAIVASVCKARKGAVVATFDRKFRAALEKIGFSVYPF